MENRPPKRGSREVSHCILWEVAQDPALVRALVWLVPAPGGHLGNTRLPGGHGGRNATHEMSTEWESRSGGRGRAPPRTCTDTLDRTAWVIPSPFDNARGQHGGRQGVEAGSAPLSGIVRSSTSSSTCLPTRPAKNGRLRERKRRRKKTNRHRRKRRQAKTPGVPPKKKVLFKKIMVLYKEINARKKQQNLVFLCVSTGKPLKNIVFTCFFRF